MDRLSTLDRDRALAAGAAGSARMATDGAQGLGLSGEPVVDSLGGLNGLRPGLGLPLSRLLPLWRHAVWLVILFVVLAVSVIIRLDVQRLEMDLDRNDRAQRAAQVLNERLTLELDSRRRLQAVEGMATALGASADVPVVRVPVHAEQPAPGGTRPHVPAEAP